MKYYLRNGVDSYLYERVVHPPGQNIENAPLNFRASSDYVRLTRYFLLLREPNIFVVAIINNTVYKVNFICSHDRVLKGLIWGYVDILGYKLGTN